MNSTLKRLHAHSGNASKLAALVMMALLLSGGLGAAQGGAGSGADQFQQSYDDEAAGKYDSALAALDRLPETRAGSYVAQLRRGWLEYRLGRYSASVESYRHAAGLAPASIEVRVGMLLPLMAERKWASAEKVAREALKLDPKNYLASLRLAYSLYNLGQYGESLALYRKLAEGYPSDVDVRDGIGWSLLKLGRNAEAAAAFTDVLDLSPKNQLAREGMAALGK